MFLKLLALKDGRVFFSELPMSDDEFDKAYKEVYYMTVPPYQ